MYYGFVLLCFVLLSLALFCLFVCFVLFCFVLVCFVLLCFVSIVCPFVAPVFISLQLYWSYRPMSRSISNKHILYIPKRSTVFICPTITRDIRCNVTV
jgi:hypothetical protein